MKSDKRVSTIPIFISLISAGALRGLPASFFPLHRLRHPAPSLVDHFSRRTRRGEQKESERGWKGKGNARRFGNLNKLYDLLNAFSTRSSIRARVKHGTLIYCFSLDIAFGVYQISLNLALSQVVDLPNLIVCLLAFNYPRCLSGAQNNDGSNVGMFRSKALRIKAYRDSFSAI